MKAIIVSLCSAFELLLSCPYARPQRQYTCFCWHRGQTARSGTWATQLTRMLWIHFTGRSFHSMLGVIVAPIYWNLMTVFSGWLHLCYASWASLCIIDVSRDWIIMHILEINGRVHKTVEMIKILRTNAKEWSAVNIVKWLNMVLKCRDDAITSLNALKHCGQCQTCHSDNLCSMLRRISVWGTFSETN